MKSFIIATLILFFSSNGFKPIVLDQDYNHDKWDTKPKDLVYQFAAYTTSFDSKDDDNGDGKSDIWGIPEWVAYEIKKVNEEHHLANRPTWMTVDSLYSKGIAPNDETYKVPGARSMTEVKTDYRFVRGHMCPKKSAERISSNAAYNTHTFLNACPQLQWQNNGIWKDLEGKCNEWADKYNQIWVVCGPVFFKKCPSMWLGQGEEVRAAIPDAFFKIVIREDGGDIETLSFLIPNILPKTESELNKYLVSIHRLEVLTGLDFLTALEDSIERDVESKVADSVNW